jgi:DNA (cytosine-5)-methyltransferase 1
MVDKIGPCYGSKAVLKKFKNNTPIDELPEKIHKGRSWKNMDREDMSPRFQKIHDNPKKYRAPNFYRRFSLTEINGTITASAQPEACGITHPFENRRYTIREIARIQSFPDDFVFPYTTIANAYKVIGNAVPPILGWVIAKAISNHLDKNA